MIIVVIHKSCADHTPRVHEKRCTSPCNCDHLVSPLIWSKEPAERTNVHEILFPKFLYLRVAHATIL